MPDSCSPPGSSVHGISQARIPEWVAISSSRGSSWPRDQTHVSRVSFINRWIVYHWATREAWCKFCRQENITSEQANRFYPPPPNSDIWVGLRHNTSSHPKLHATAVEIWSLYQCQRSWNKAGGLKQQKWLLHSSRGEKSEIRISSGLCCLCNL